MIEATTIYPSSPLLRFFDPSGRFRGRITDALTGEVQCWDPDEIDPDALPPTDAVELLGGDAPMTRREAEDCVRLLSAWEGGDYEHDDFEIREHDFGSPRFPLVGFAVFLVREGRG